MRILSRKIVAGVLVLSMIFVVGCSSHTTKKTVNVTNQPNEAQKKSAPVELSVEVFDRSTPGYAADNNIQTQWIQEKFGKPNNINIKFVPVVRAQEIDKLKVLMSANQAPDICFTYNSELINNFASSGSLTELDKLLKKAPKLQKFIGKDLLKTGTLKGIQYTIPARRTIDAAIATFIRKDWLDKLGLPLPKTKQEFYNTLKAFKQKDPGKVGDKLIPFALFLDSNNSHWSTKVIEDSFRPKMTDEEINTLGNWSLPGFKDAYKYLNKLYSEGLINHNFAIESKEIDKQAMAGNVGSVVAGYDNPYRPPNGTLLELKKNIPDAELVAIDSFENSEGKYLKSKYALNGFYIFIPKSSKCSAEAIKYLEWMTNLDVLKYLQNGEKGIHYTDEKDGIPNNFVASDKVPAEKKANFIDLSIIVNGKEFGSEQKNIESASYAYPGFETLFKQAYKVAENDAFPMVVEKALPSITNFGKALNQKDIEIIVKSISCNPKEFDSTYDKLVKEYMDAGGQQIIDEKKADYKANK